MSSFFKKGFLFKVLFLFIVLDLCYSFWQHAQMPIDGDLAKITVPASEYKRVLESPFGLSTITKRESYAATNRFVIHWSISNYFKAIPLALRKVLSPIDSVYISCALFKTLSQALILYLLAVFISGKRNVLNDRFIVAAALIAPLFQTEGFANTMGIIDKSITYSFFYAFSCLLILFFLFLLYQTAKKSSAGKWVNIFFLFILAIIIPFSGPLSAPIAIIGIPILLYTTAKGDWEMKLNPIHQLKKLWRGIPTTVKLPCVLLFLLSLYSLYIGQFNTENSTTNISLLERYARLPRGLFLEFTNKLGLPILLISVLVNVYLIGKMKRTSESDKVKSTLKALLLFSVIFILLLPLGGYRDYRPDIIRRDSILPVLLILIYSFGLTTHYLFKQFKGQQLKVYTLASICILLVFINADKGSMRGNACERQALEQIARSDQDEVQLKEKCPVLSWNVLSHPRDSKLNGELLRLWGITEVNKTYFFME